MLKLVVLSLAALWDSISVYIGPSPRKREKEERKDRGKKCPNNPHPHLFASAVGPCPTVIQIVGRPGTGSLPSTIAPPDHPLHAKDNRKHIPIMPPDLVLWLTLSSQHYSCLEHIFMALKVFEPLKFCCISDFSGMKFMRHQYFSWKSTIPDSSSKWSPFQSKPRGYIFFMLNQLSMNFSCS